VLAGITPDELRRPVTETEIVNGFLNRFLIVAVSRPRLLSSPPPLNGSIVNEYATAFADALTFARREGAGAIDRSPVARAR
jgi:hypothetical protein